MLKTFQRPNSVFQFLKLARVFQSQCNFDLKYNTANVVKVSKNRVTANMITKSGYVSNHIANQHNAKILL